MTLLTLSLLILLACAAGPLLLGQLLDALRRKPAPDYRGDLPIEARHAADRPALERPYTDGNLGVGQ